MNTINTSIDSDYMCFGATGQPGTSPNPSRPSGQPTSIPSMNIKQDVAKYKLGNINMYKFLDTLYGDNHITALHIDESKIYKTINISVHHTNHINTDEIINEKLKRLSKHSRIYKFVLMHTSRLVSSYDTNITNYVINGFKKNKFKKPNPSGPSTLSINTLESMLGLSKEFYTSVVHKVCNNGDRYIFNVNCNFFDLDIAGTIEYLKVKMQKIVSKHGYYAKVFCDDDANLNVIITRKKSYYDGDVPKITKRHIYNILGVNEYLYGSCYIKHSNYGTIYTIVDIISSVYDIQYTENEIFDKLVKVFGKHYKLKKISGNYHVSISFTPLTDDEVEFVKWVEEQVTNIVPLSSDYYDRIEALKRKAETLEERCARYTPPLYDNEKLNVSKQLTTINKLLLRNSLL